MKLKEFFLKEPWDISSCDDETFLTYYLLGKRNGGKIDFSTHGQIVFITYEPKKRKPYNRTLTNKLWKQENG